MTRSGGTRQLLSEPNSPTTSLAAAAAAAAPACQRERIPLGAIEKAARSPGRVNLRAEIALERRSLSPARLPASSAVLDPAAAAAASDARQPGFLPPRRHRGKLCPGWPTPGSCVRLLQTGQVPVRSQGAGTQEEGIALAPPEASVGGRVMGTGRRTAEQSDCPPFLPREMTLCPPPPSDPTALLFSLCGERCREAGRDGAFTRGCCEQGWATVLL